MTAYLATPKLSSLAGRTAGLGDRTASRTTVARAVASDAGSVVDARTPFYDQLRSMIDETRLENRRVQHDQESHAAPLAANPRWSVGQILTGTAGLIVVVAVGSAVIEAAVRSMRQPTVVAAETAPEKRSVVVAGTATPEAPPVARSLLAAEPDGAGAIDIKGKGVAGSGFETGSIVVATPEEPPVTKPAAAPSGEKLDSGSGSAKEAANEAGKEVRIDGPADGSVSTKAAHAAVSAPAEDPPSEKAAADAPLLPAPGSKSAATVSGSAPIRIARIASDVNMRAGPSNGQPVVATLARGSAVEVIECRAWCEVIFRGQRGWVYKGFIGASENPHRR